MFLQGGQRLSVATNRVTLSHREKQNCKPSRIGCVRRVTTVCEQSTFNADGSDSNTDMSVNGSGKKRANSLGNRGGNRTRQIELPLNQIIRPLSRTRSNDKEKVKWLMESIADEGLREPIDVLEVEGKFYGFSGCHRYEAHQRLGKETIRCRVRKSTVTTLKRHLM